MLSQIILSPACLLCSDVSWTVDKIDPLVLIYYPKVLIN